MHPKASRKIIHMSFHSFFTLEGWRTITPAFVSSSESHCYFIWRSSKTRQNQKQLGIRDTIQSALLWLENN